MFSTGFTSFGILLLFPLSITIVDKVLSGNPSVNVVFFGNFNVYKRDWLSYFDGTDRPGIIYMA